MVIPTLLSFHDGSTNAEKNNFRISINALKHLSPRTRITYYYDYS